MLLFKRDKTSQKWKMKIFYCSRYPSIKGRSGNEVIISLWYHQGDIEAWSMVLEDSLLFQNSLKYQIVVENE